MSFGNKYFIMAVKIIPVLYIVSFFLVLVPAGIMDMDIDALWSWAYIISGTVISIVCLVIGEKADEKNRIKGFNGRNDGKIGQKDSNS